MLIIWQGAFRKWFLPGLATPLYVAKDIVLVGALALYGMRHRFQLRPSLRQTALPVLWSGLAFIVVLQVFNFNFPSIPGSVIGARSYLLYTALLILMPPIMDRIRRPERVLTWVVVLGIVPILLLGFYQYGQPVDAWINQYVADEANVVGVLSRPRITGTFSYIGGMGAFLSSVLFLAMGMFLAGLRYGHRWYTWMGGALLAFTLIVAPMNGSRSVVLGMLVPLPFVLYAVLSGKQGVYIGVLVGLLALSGSYVAEHSGWVSQGWEGIEHRMETASDQDTRVQSMLTDPFRKIPVGGLLGYGTGGTHNAAGALAGGRVDVGVGYEGEVGRVIIELGVIGGALYILLKVWLVWIAWQALRRANTAWEALLGITVFSQLLLSMGTGMIVFNHIAGAMYWLYAGIAVWLWSRQEERQKAFRAMRQRVQSVSNAGRG
ncbi:hypothetical protein CRI93_09510 [Longimonas halophila]|uniref:Ligase n=1 Tax=Longimonas halophila TaxID=1469170 RepID=A0A2H3NKY6_9BACT|nr:hypothetical protein CRI93_09510 [Longimonas halophila]